MKYFCKYLPVEGEIKDGDKTQTPDGTIWNSIGDSPNINGTHKKVKLFLCSKNIQVGDEIQTTHNDATGKVREIKEDKAVLFGKNFFTAKELCFRVIGEISPEATWVKEGDEFEEDDILFELDISEVYGDTWFTGVTEEEWLKTTDTYKMYVVHEKTIKIKGPCGHFH